jgi:hypothetical protein
VSTQSTVWVIDAPSSPPEELDVDPPPDPEELDDPLPPDPEELAPPLDPALPPELDAAPESVAPNPVLVAGAADRQAALASHTTRERPLKTNVRMLFATA